VDNRINNIAKRVRISELAFSSFSIISPNRRKFLQIQLE